ncbi:MAG TPA: hypothetical protein VE645_18975 [Pseudonocardiaceae bacterium]|jgi:hypothetical protein|nr:hypothetical protein [Pseudonocardiaceae bacterium]
MSYPRCYNLQGTRSKTSYPSAARARKYARINGEQLRRASLRIYGPCKYCGGWHITKQPPRDQTNHTTR